MIQEFNLENEYQTYLKRVGLDESKMHSAQKIETKRAFFGAFGQLLIMFKDGIIHLKEDELMMVFEDLIRQVAEYWSNESKAKFLRTNKKGAK